MKAPVLAPEAMERALDAHLRQVKAALRQRPEMSVLWVEHRGVLGKSGRVLESIREFLGVPLDLSAMAAEVDLSLYRQRQSTISIT
jgi:hypothetical protein